MYILNSSVADPSLVKGDSRDIIREFMTKIRLVIEGAKSNNYLMYDMSGHSQRKRIVERQPTTNQLATVALMTSLSKHEIGEDSAPRAVSVRSEPSYSQSNVYQTTCQRLILTGAA